MADGTSHDQNFKNLIVDYPREALAFFAPGEAPGPEDRASFVPVRQEQLQERLDGGFRALDAPLRVEWADGGRDAVLFALEEETDRRRFSVPRLARYCLDLADMFDTDRVVPVVIFLRGAGGAPGPLSLGTERRAYLTFDYLWCGLGDMSADDWLDSDNVVARINLPNMRVAEGRRVEVYARAVSGLLDLEPDAARRAKYLDFIDIYADLTDNERRQYRREHPEESRTMAGIVQRAREEGIEQGIRQGTRRGMKRGIERGIEQGISRGRAEGERALLRRLLRRRFGLLPPAVSERLDRASEGDLESWAERVLDAGSLDEVFDR